MSSLSFAISTALLSSLAASVVAQVVPGTTPLINQHYAYPSQIPYKVDNNPAGRGPQFGYTRCNSTTEGPESNCQLALMNSISDFCLWGPATANSTIADTEAATVAWCSAPGHGTRVMPQGTLTGVQVLKAPAYVLFSGTISQANVDIQAGDEGGELDPRGADLRGNPLGGLVYSNAFPSNGGNNNSFQQVSNWHNFMGSDVFCFKICDPSIPNSFQYCNNIFDETGCDFVAPAAYQEGAFEVCESDNMDPVGVYTSNGQVLTYTQGAGDIPSVRTPASSNCQTYTSSVLYSAAPTAATPVASASASGSAAPSASASVSLVSSGTAVITKVVSSTGATGKANAPASTSPASSNGTSTNAAVALSVGSGFASFLSVAVTLLAGMGAATLAL